ncbi:MAG: alpha/beta hydrolase [Hyphomicrobium sp.]
MDADRPEVFTADPNVRRALMVQIWYPAGKNPSAPRAPYVQDADALAPALAGLLNFPEFAFQHLKYVTANAIPSAPVSDDEPSYPVLIFLEGTLGFRQMNTFQVEELASHGYVVAAIDHPYMAAAVVFPDGRAAAGLPRHQTKVLIDQSLGPAETAPILNGRALENGIIPYLAQDTLFHAGPACRPEPSRPERLPDRAAEPGACRHSWSLTGRYCRQRSLPARATLAGLSRDGCPHACRRGPDGLATADNVDHPGC